MDTVITTCGISILTNYAKAQKLVLPLTENANKRDKQEVDKQASIEIEEMLALMGKSISELATDNQASAEINSLHLYYQEKNDSPKSDRHVLISTDTWLGSEATELVKQALLHRGYENIVVKKVSKLSTANFRDFRDAAAELLSMLIKYQEEANHRRSEVVINLTGGFKSLLITIQSFAAAYKVKCFNLFEGNSSILWLPLLPTRFDPAEFVRANLNEFRLLNSEICNTIPEDLAFAALKVADNVYMLSDWGEALWQTYHHDIYEEKLLDPPISGIVYGPKFKEQAEKFARKSSKLAELNSKIDTISFLYHNDNSGNPIVLKGTTMKPIRGCHGVSTHEIYASNDDATRIYMHIEGGKWVLDTLGKHL